MKAFWYRIVTWPCMGLSVGAELSEGVILRGELMGLTDRLEGIYR